MKTRLLAAIPAALALVASAAPSAPAEATTLSVMSYNVQWGAPGGRRLDEIARVIASSGADVVGVQQLRRWAGTGLRKGPYDCSDQPAKLASMLSSLTGHRWSWAWAKNRSGRKINAGCRGKASRPHEEGVAVFSRYPIVSSARYPLPYQRSLAKARIRLSGGRVVTVFTVHLDSSSEGSRRAQAQNVARIVGGTGGTTFLTGDMNNQPGTGPIRLLSEVVRDSWLDGGSGSGATRRSRIDFVFYKPSGATVQSARVIQNWASDHRPVIARFTVR